MSPVSLTALAEGKVDLTDPNFSEGDDIVELEPNHVPATLDAPQDRMGCCGTMLAPEFVIPDQETIESGVPLSDDDLLEDETRELAQAFQ